MIKCNSIITSHFSKAATVDSIVVSIVVSIMVFSLAISLPAAAKAIDLADPLSQQPYFEDAGLHESELPAPVLQGLASHDHAVALENDQHFDQAIDQYEEIVLSLENAIGPYASELVAPLMGMARSYVAIGDYAVAIAAIQRAQHIQHRQTGVHTLDQLTGIDLNTKIYLLQDDMKGADKQQAFALFIAEHNVAGDSLALLPALNKINNWYIETGQFNRARRSLVRSENILAQHKGEFNPMLLPTLYQRAKVKRLQRACCSHKLLESALEQVETNSAVSHHQRTEFYLELADSYTIADKKDKASYYYRLAWVMMSNKQRYQEFYQPRKIAFSRTLDSARSSSTLRIFQFENDRFGRKEMRELTIQEKLVLDSLPPQEFYMPLNENNYNVRIQDKNMGGSYEEKYMRTTGTPFQFSEKQVFQLLPYNLQTQEILAQLIIELEFTVGPKGNIYDIHASALNGPNNLNRLMKHVLRRSRFRPRMVDGEPIETTHVKLSQTFNTK